MAHDDGMKIAKAAKEKTESIIFSNYPPKIRKLANNILKIPRV